MNHENHPLRLRYAAVVTLAVAAAAVGLHTRAQGQQKGLGYTDTPFLPGGKWRVHDGDRPQPPVIQPGTASTQEQAGRPPSDATVLFGGEDLSKWQSDKGGPAEWKVENGYFEVTRGKGGIRTRDEFGDAQLHVEFSTPNPPRGEGQGRGNSGVFFFGRYEVQVLDSYRNKTYPDGQAASIYGQYPPLVNATRPPGEWQSYDIVFRAPRFDPAGRLTTPARMTVLHNGVLVHDAVELTGPTGHYERPPYRAHAARLPISLQDHGAPVRYRNIWLRELGDG